MSCKISLVPEAGEHILPGGGETSGSEHRGVTEAKFLCREFIRNLRMEHFVFVSRQGECRKH